MSIYSRLPAIIKDLVADGVKFRAGICSQSCPRGRRTRRSAFSLNGQGQGSKGSSRPESQASPPGFWYDQDWTEWVIVLAGSTGVLIEGEDAPRILAPGDYLEIPPHVRHQSRVDQHPSADRLARRARAMIGSHRGVP